MGFMYDGSINGSYDLHGDDTSDDESLNQDIDLFETLSEFTAREEDPYQLKEVDPDGYSFYAYNKALQIFTSPEVDSLYKEKKKQLGTPEIYFEDSDLLTWIFTATKKAMQDCFIQCHNPGALATKIMTIIENCFKKSEVSELYLSVYKRVLLTQVRKKNIMEETREQGEFLLDFIKYAVSHDVSVPSLSREIDYFDITSFNNDNKWLEHVRFKVKVYLKKIQFLNSDSRNLVSKPIRKSLLPTIEPSNLFEEKIIKYFTTIKFNELATTLDDNIADLSSAYLKNVVDKIVLSEDPLIEKNKKNPKTFRFTKPFNYKSHSDFKYLSLDSIHQFIPRDPETVRKNLLQSLDLYFFKKFSKYLASEKSKFEFDWKRAIKTEHHKFASSSMIEYLANLRLAYREQKRFVRQYQDEDIVKSKHVFQRSWQFGSIPALAQENDEVTTNFAISDKVLEFERYKKINLELVDHINKINEMIKPNKIADKDIARWILHIFKHEPVELLLINTKGKQLQIKRAAKEDLIRFLVKMTYLLLGCEVIRNPAGLVTQILLIEKIADGQLSWKAALADEVRHKDKKGMMIEIPYGGGAIPNTMGQYRIYDKKEKKLVSKKTKTTQCARVLQKHYGMFAIKKYKYPGSNLKKINVDQVQELVKRESNVIQDAATSYEADNDLENLKKLDYDIDQFFGLSI